MLSRSSAASSSTWYFLSLSQAFSINLAKKEYEEDLALTGGAGDVWWVADKKLLKFLKDWDAWATDHSKPMPDEVEYFKKCDPNVPRLKPISHSDYLGGTGWFPIGTFL